MELKVITLSEKGLENNDWQGYYAIEIGDQKIVELHDGDPEDNNLGRNFNDVYNIPILAKITHELGKRGEELTIINVEVDEIP